MSHLSPNLCANVKRPQRAMKQIKTEVHTNNQTFHRKQILHYLSRIYTTLHKKTFLTFSKQFSTLPSLHLRFTFATPSLHLRYTFATTLLFVRFDIRGIAMMQQCAIKTQRDGHLYNVNIFKQPTTNP